MNTFWESNAHEQVVFDQPFTLVCGAVFDLPFDLVFDPKPQTQP